MSTTNNNNNNLIDGLGSFFNGNSTLRIDVGISTESMIKLAVVAVVTTLVCMCIDSKKPEIR